MQYPYLSGMWILDDNHRWDCPSPRYNPSENVYLWRSLVRVHSARRRVQRQGDTTVFRSHNIAMYLYRNIYFNNGGSETVIGCKQIVGKPDALAIANVARYCFHLVC